VLKPRLGKGNAVCIEDLDLSGTERSRVLGILVNIAENLCSVLSHVSSHIAAAEADHNFLLRRLQYWIKCSAWA
jgi:hypothetical protein